MKGYFTVYARQVKRRKTGVVETVGEYYRTASLTPMHAHIREMHPGARTYKDPQCIYTESMPGINIRMRPLVSGGELVAGDE